jgi:hypothetical protein
MNRLVMSAAQQYRRPIATSSSNMSSSEPMAAAQLRAPSVRGQGGRLSLLQGEIADAA